MPFASATARRALLARPIGGWREAPGREIKKSLSHVQQTRYAALTSPFRFIERHAHMNINAIPIGDNPPESLNVIIEVPVGGEPVKYEFDKASGALFVDRILHTPMRYPANYGFVPHTLSPDGDPLDALVVARSPFMPGCVVRCRPIAVLNLEDEHGGDEKLLCVPIDATFPYYRKIGEGNDLPEIVMQQVEHFFTHYKDLEKEKWVRVGKWGDAEEARRVVVEAIELAKKSA